MEFRKLNADEIELRVGVVHDKDKNGNPYKDQWFTLLLYKTARVDANILDETVGPFNWQKRFYQVKNTMVCSVGIYDKDRKEFIWKDDVGDETQTEAIKGEASDSFKRAGFAWGIGRELYNSPFIKLDINEKNDPKRTRYEVKEIAYNGNEITKLVIVYQYTNEIAYTFPKNAKTTSSTPTQEPKPVEKPKTKITAQDIIDISNYLMVASDEDITKFENYLIARYGTKDYRDLDENNGRLVANFVRKKVNNG